MDTEHECEECGEPATVLIEKEPCDDDCRLGCNHPTKDHWLCEDCANTPSNEQADRAYRRAEQGHCE